MIALLFRQDYISIKNFVNQSNSRKLIAIVFILIISFFTLSLFLIFERFFSYLNHYTEIGDIISRIVLGYSYFLVFILMIPSYLFSSLVTFYYNKSLHVIITTPKSDHEIYDALLIKGFLSGLWPLIMIGLPILFAYSSVYNISILYTLFILLMFIPLSIISYSFGIFLNYLLFKLKLIDKIWFWIIAVITFVFTLPQLIRYLIPESLQNLYFAPTIKQLSLQSEQLPILNNNLPSKWITNLTTQSEFILSTSLIIAWACILLFLVILLSRDMFLDNWQKAQEGTLLAGSKGFKHYHNGKAFITKFNINISLVYRYFSSITRDNSALASTIFLFMLSAIAITLLFNVAGYRVNNTEYSTYLNIFSFITINFIITIFALKFIFPLANFNLKDHLLISSPISSRKLTSSFLIYASVLIVILSIIFTLPFILNNSEMLGSYKLLYLIASIFTSITIALISLIIGTIAADHYKELNQDISSSIEGITTTIIAVFINILCGIFLYNVFSIMNNNGGNGNFVAGIIFAFIPMLTIVFLLIGKEIIPQILRTKVSI